MAIETTANNKHENWVWKGISRDLGVNVIRVALTAYGI